MTTKAPLLAASRPSALFSCGPRTTVCMRSHVASYAGSAILLFISLCCCGAANADRLSDDNESEIYDPSRVHRIEIEIPQEAWHELRHQSHDFRDFATSEFLSSPPERPYTYFRADVVIDGARFESVGLRKKGFVGSVNATRPSLKIKFDEFQNGQEYLGASRLTLQNNGTVRQWLANEMFRTAGVPAPRCGFAEVIVNGVSFGLYGLIEPIKKPFLREHFGDDEGNLYEGRLSDFRPSFADTFEKKTNKKEIQRDDLDAMVATLALEDDRFLEEAEKVVDLDNFLRYWATTSLMGFWDSYAGSSNNFYCYNNPANGKFQFIPWAPDSAFTGAGFFTVEPRPQSVFANGHLCRRLWRFSEIRERYRDEMRTLLSDVWNEASLNAELDRLELMLARYPVEVEIEQIREFIESRREIVEDELAGDLPDWPIAPESTPVWTSAGTLKGNFSFIVEDATISLDTEGMHELVLERDGVEYVLENYFFKANAPGPAGLWFCFLGSHEDVGDIGIIFDLPPEFYTQDRSLRMDGNVLKSWGVFNAGEALTLEDVKLHGLGITLGTFESVATDEDGLLHVTASFQADILRIPIR